MAEASIKSEKPKHIVFKGEEDLSKSLAKYTADLSEKFVSERGAFTVVLSGGSLIESLRKLLEAPYVDTVEWAKWHVFWVDERVVKKDHPDSNYKLAFDGFLSKVVELSKDNGFPKFDLMLLGMGPDGHVASLFPGHPLVKENQRWVTFIKDSPKPPPQRITFTFPVINSSSYIAQVVCGSNEAAAVHSALGTEKTSDPLPAAMVSLKDGELTWFLDEAAASLLQD
ncbi:hypothetical protein QJS10_CPB11g00638 [Acorus calamus]|uniref:Glucosamine/galactosamine-6-phosphate isomerase domain-containing protein n=1 Tax=Acorus calamus TaxID=4465 RepID=A0AAV9DUL8_ACOCL|nr:hypothetical protein QJS10_CPB11g00638 [Acorus calamus]